MELCDFNIDSSAESQKDLMLNIFIALCGQDILKIGICNHLSKKEEKLYFLLPLANLNVFKNRHQKIRLKKVVAEKRPTGCISVENLVKGKRCKNDRDEC